MLQESVAEFGFVRYSDRNAAITVREGLFAACRCKRLFLSVRLLAHRCGYGALSWPLRQTLSPICLPYFSLLYVMSFGTQNASMRLRPDPRAVQICPLVSQRAVKRCAPRFIRHVKEAVRLLSYEPLIREDFLKTAEFLDAMYDFYEKIVQ